MAASISLAYEPQATPKGVKGPLAEKTVARITCGQNHCIAVDTEGACYTWGFGGYGRCVKGVNGVEVWVGDSKRCGGITRVQTTALLFRLADRGQCNYLAAAHKSSV